MSRASDSYNKGKSDGLKGLPYNNPYKKYLEYDLWFEYDNGYRDGQKGK